ncbi:MAG: hypothetical protein ACREJ9_05925 [Candidatus Rokuibacteriota bacterium]
MREPVSNHNPAPLGMVRFIEEILEDGRATGRVVAVDVEDGTHRLTLTRPDHGLSIHQLSAWDVSRSVRGDPDALAAIRAGLLGDAAR